MSEGKSFIFLSQVLKYQACHGRSVIYDSDRRPPLLEPNILFM